MQTREPDDRQWATPAGAAPTSGPPAAIQPRPATQTKVPLANRRWLLPGAVGVLAAGVIAGCVMGGLALIPSGGGAANRPAAQPTQQQPPIDPAPTPSAPPTGDASQAPTLEVPAAGSLRNGARCLEMPKDDNATRARMTDCSGARKQTWQFKTIGGDVYQLINRDTGKCLDVKGRSKDDGVVIQQFSCHDDENQKWRIRWHSVDTFALVGIGSDKCADVEDDGDVKQRGCADKDSQFWTAGNG
jgi:hypothetical protein